jgi:hypothetical protein
LDRLSPSFRTVAIAGTLLCAALGLVAACADTSSPARPYHATPTVDADVCEQAPLPDGGAVHVTGSVVVAGTEDAASPTPIGGAMIAVEYGGLYLPWCDLGHASPYYIFGAVTDASGKFELNGRQGPLGFHSFANDYLYSRAGIDSSTTTSVRIMMVPLPKGQQKPRVTNAGFDKTTAHPGEPVTFSATLATWAGTDPLSDENVLVEATHSWALELDPPSLGAKDDFPDGLWRRSFFAPTTPGKYTYWFSSTTSQCITSDLLSAELTVQ